MTASCSGVRSIFCNASSSAYTSGERFDEQQIGEAAAGRNGNRGGNGGLRTAGGAEATGSKSATVQEALAGPRAGEGVETRTVLEARVEVGAEARAEAGAGAGATAGTKTGAEGAIARVRAVIEATEESRAAELRRKADHPREGKTLGMVTRWSKA